FQLLVHPPAPMRFPYTTLFRSVGGMGTKIGTPANSIFAGWVSTNLGREIGFLEFLLIGLPFMLVLLPLIWWRLWRLGRHDAPRGDRKSTRLNSSHVKISYAVFC